MSFLIEWQMIQLNTMSRSNNVLVLELHSSSVELQKGPSPSRHSNAHDDLLENNYGRLLLPKTSWMRVWHEMPVDDHPPFIAALTEPMCERLGPERSEWHWKSHDLRWHRLTATRQFNQSNSTHLRYRHLQTTKLQKKNCPSSIFNLSKSYNPATLEMSDSISASVIFFSSVTTRSICVFFQL